MPFPGRESMFSSSCDALCGRMERPRQAASLAGPPRGARAKESMALPHRALRFQSAQPMGDGAQIEANEVSKTPSISFLCFRESSLINALRAISAQKFFLAPSSRSKALSRRPRPAHWRSTIL